MKYEVRWKFLKEVHCFAEVEADSVKEAIEKAQEYDGSVDERDGEVYEVFPPHLVRPTQ